MSKKQNIFLGFLVLFLWVLWYVSWFVTFLESLLSLLLYSVITFWIYFLWKTLRRKKALSFWEYQPLFFAKVGSMLLLLVVILWGFAYYENQIAPANMPLYVISNGKKEVYFQAMIHIGSESFYSQVQKEIQEAKRQGFVLFFEWVKPWSEESEKAFNEALWAKFDKKLYENFSKLYGLTFQNNADLLEQVNNLDFNIDLSLDEIVALYKQKVKETNKSTLASPEIQDIDAQVMEQLAHLNNRELKILVYINQSLLNFIIKNDTLKSTIMNEFWNQELFQVILGERNKRLAQAISTSEYDKIFVTYGLLHFQGVLDILQKQDPNWKIIKIEPRYPIHP